MDKLSGEQSMLNFFLTIIPVCYATLIIFKLTHILSISWWIIFAPIWIPFVVAILFFICTLILITIVSVDNKKENNMLWRNRL